MTDILLSLVFQWVLKFSELTDLFSYGLCMNEIWHGESVTLFMFDFKALQGVCQLKLLDDSFADWDDKYDPARM